MKAQYEFLLLTGRTVTHEAEERADVVIDIRPKGLRVFVKRRLPRSGEMFFEEVDMFLTLLPPDRPPDEQVMAVNARPCERLGIGTMAVNALAGHGIYTIGDVKKASAEGPLSRFKGIGPGTVKKVAEALAAEEDMNV